MSIGIGSGNFIFPEYLGYQGFNIANFREGGSDKKQVQYCLLRKLSGIIVGISKVVWDWRTGSQYWGSYSMAGDDSFIIGSGLTNYTFISPKDALDLSSIRTKSIGNFLSYVKKMSATPDGGTSKFPNWNFFASQLASWHSSVDAVIGAYDFQYINLEYYRRLRRSGAPLSYPQTANTMPLFCDWLIGVLKTATNLAGDDFLNVAASEYITETSTKFELSFVIVLCENDPFETEDIGDTGTITVTFRQLK